MSSNSRPAVPARFAGGMFHCSQVTLRLRAAKRGCHLITDQVLEGIKKELSRFQCGLANIFLQHTSASLTLNENWDSDVRLDTEDALNRLVPESGPGISYRHDAEGKDDMPAHVKSSLFGASLTIPITNGRLSLGTWQGIWLCEHRDHASGRTIVITLSGMVAAPASAGAGTRASMATEEDDEEEEEEGVGGGRGKAKQEKKKGGKR